MQMWSVAWEFSRLVISEDLLVLAFYSRETHYGDYMTLNELKELKEKVTCSTNLWPELIITSMDAVLKEREPEREGE